jgi:RND family efflux transporter MFP subunit
VVAKPGEESSLNTITLTPQAEQRLGIVLAEVRLADVRQIRQVGGEVVVPVGQTVIVAAPIDGTLAAASGHPVPLPGSHLEPGQTVFELAPLLTPERDVLTLAERLGIAQTKANMATAQLEAERQIESARLNVEAAQIAYNRAVQLLESRAGSQRSVDEAEASLKLARDALATAEARHEFLAAVELDEEAGQSEPRDVTAPIGGVLQSLAVAAGESVVTGMELFRVAQLDRLWIRVPLYVGDWRAIDTGQEATIREYGQPPETPGRSAVYVSAPPSADPLANTIDLYYEVDNSDARLQPGQRLSVTLPLQNEDRQLVVPQTAILYDLHGGTWVYEEIGPQTFARRRVDVRYASDANAVLANGPPPGTKVVTDGAAELFGTEFGVGK